MIRLSTRFPHLTGVCVLVALACVLYIPFLKNPFIFDDLTVFSGSGFARFATLPSGIILRHLPYFSLAFPQIVWGHFPPWGHPEIHRVISLVFHIASSLALYKLLHDLLLAARTPLDVRSVEDARAHARTLAFVGAAVFAVHPVAVYGAGYLIQRTIVLATLFSLLSMTYFVRGLSRGSHADAISAALFYTLAVLSKEHSVLLPVAAVMATPLLAKDARFATRYAVIYLLACLPAAAAVVTLVLGVGVIGETYEYHYSMLLTNPAGIPDLDRAGGPWLVSAVTQSGLFFRYLAAWLVPDISAMSIDMRIDFAQSWSPAWIVLKVAAYAAFGALGLILLLRRGKAGWVGFGLLYFWILFLVEFSTARFQEPFVLYRSYLWAPGILIALAALLSGCSRKVALAAFIAVCPVLLYQAHDRLRTFSSNMALWADAAAKLPSTPVPWGWRPLYNWAREQTHAGNTGQAIETVNLCMSRYTGSSRCYFARGAIHNYVGEHEQALPYLNRALAIEPKFAVGHYQRGIALEKLGRLDEARAEYRESSRLGYFGGYQK